MRYNVLAILVGFLLLTVVFGLLGTGILVAGISAHVVAQSGTIEVRRAGRNDWQPLPNGDVARVKVGDALRTGSDGTVTLHWADGTTLKVAPDSLLTVRKYQLEAKEPVQVSVLKLDLGKVWTRVSHELTGDSRFEIETPSAVAAVTGTIFSVTASAEGTSVEVYDGSVDLTADGQTKSVAKDTVARVKAGQIETAAFEPSQAEDWSAQAVLLPTVRFAKFLPGLVKDGSYKLKGTAEPGAKLTVDGREIPVETDGTFACEVKVEAGANSYDVVVTDAAGHVNELTHTVEFQPSK